MGPGIIEVFLEYWPMFLKGALGTLRYAAIAVAGGTILGALIAIMRLSGNKLLAGIATIYTDVLRGTPLLVQMYIAYFFLPLVFPVLNKVDKEVTVLIALTLNSSAYVSEIIRGGINSVDIGQTEAARSLGMSASHTMTKIILPQAVKNILPSLANEFILLIKNTSIVSVIAIQELTYKSSIVRTNTFRAFEPLIVSAFIYFTVTWILNQGVRVLERRLHRND